MSASDMPKNSPMQDTPEESFEGTFSVSGNRAEWDDSALAQPEQPVPSAPSTADEPISHESLDADMLRQGPRVIVYIFSGPHLGAEISLPLGNFLVGSDASCDIILQGSSLAPRHASINISMTGGSVSVEVKPLDGGVSLESASLASSVASSNSDSAEVSAEVPESLTMSPCQPNAGDPWYLGLTCMVWNRPGVLQAMPHIVVGASPRAVGALEGSSNDIAANSVGGLGVSASEVGRQDSAGASPVPRQGAEKALKLDTSGKDASPLAFQAPQDSARKKKNTISRLVATLFLFGALAVLSVIVGPTRINPDQYTEIIENKIFQAGLPPLKVSRFGMGVEVSGEVKNDAERATLYTLAHGLHFPVYLDRITVQNDRMNAVRAAFSARGFLPSIAMKDVLMPVMDSRIGYSAAPELSENSSLPSRDKGEAIPEAVGISQRQNASQDEPSNKSVGTHELTLTPDSRGLLQTTGTPVSTDASVVALTDKKDGVEDAAGGPKSALAAAPSTPSHIGTDATQESPSPVQVMVISAYIKDALLEESMFAALQMDVPNLPPIKRHIVHQEALADVLQPALDKAGLGFAEVRYLPNKVEIAGEFDQDGLMRARMVLEETGKTLGIPVPSLIQVRVAQQFSPATPTSVPGEAPELASLMPRGSNSAETAGSPKSGSSSRVALQQPSFGSAFGSGDVLGGLKVTGVTMTPMRFVTTSDGQRLFEGSELPSGYTLETISTSTLTLRKGGQMVSYPLRGSS